MAILLEEYGHFIDSVLNQNDAPGDEGALFAALVLGKDLSETTLKTLQSENDSVTLNIDGKQVVLEQALFEGTAGDDVIDLGSGSDVDDGHTVDGKEGNDTLIVDFTNANFSYVSSGLESHTEGIDGRDYWMGRVLTWSNIENLNLAGTPYNDVLVGFDGNDTLKGGNGNDELDGGGGNNTLLGQDGNDTVSGNANDTLDGGGGTDTLNLDLSDTTVPVVLELTRQTNQLTYPNTQVNNFEVAGTIKTGSGDDEINLGNSNTVDNGGFVDMGEGNDTLIVDFTNANSSYISDGIYNHADGVDGRSYWLGRLFTWSNVENFELTGTPYADLLVGFTGQDTLKGGSGDDTISGAVNDDLDGGEGYDTLNLDLSSLTTTVSVNWLQTSNQVTHQNIAVKNFENIGTLSTGTGDDIIDTGNTDILVRQAVIDAGIGNDTFVADYSTVNFSYVSSGIYNHADGIDGRSYWIGRLVTTNNFENWNLTGTPYNDVLVGFGGNDTLKGGGGADELKADDGDDTYIVDATNGGGTTIYDTSGNDRLILENGAVVLARAVAGTLGLGRIGSSLIVDINQDGGLSTGSDLVIQNFYGGRYFNTPGVGFIENVGNLSGQSILQTDLLDQIFIGTLTETPRQFTDSLSPTDTEDGYFFTLANDGQVKITVDNPAVSMTLLYESVGNQNVIGRGQTIQANLFAGTYLISLKSSQDNDYTLSAGVISLEDQAGNSLDKARNLGILNGSRTFDDFVGVLDPVDFYRFELNRDSTFNFTVSDGVQVELLNRQGTAIALEESEPLANGVYYLRVGPNGSGNYNYTLGLEATPSGPAPALQIKSVTPDAGSNLGSTTVMVEGSLFSPDAKVFLVAPNGTTRQASSVIWYDESTLSATFSLKDLATGGYGLKVEAGGQSASVNNTFDVNSKAVNGAGIFNNDGLEVSLVVPGEVRPWWTGEAVITYHNTTGGDLVAPLLTLTSDLAQMRLSGNTSFDSNSIQFLAGGSDANPGVLSPGESGTFTAQFLPNPSTSNFRIDFAVDSAKLHDQGVSTTFDWNAVKPTLKPESISDQAWDIIWSNFIDSVGSEVFQYQTVLAENATYLSRLGETTNDVSRLFSFELLQAGNFGTIAQRFELGQFGYGHQFPFDYSLSENAQGDVSINIPGRSGTFVKQPDGSYLAPSGCSCTLTKTGALYEVHEGDGSKLVFSTAGRILYIDDPNNNRTSFIYTGANLTRVEYPTSDSLTFTYNGQGRVVSATDQAGRSTTYSYDSTGKYLLSFTDVSGTTSYTYVTDAGPAKNAISSITSPDGSKVQWQYDDQGRVSRQSLNGGEQVVSYSYDSTGGITVTDANGAITKTFVNDRGQLAKVVDPLNRSLLYRYDDQGNLTQLVGPDQTVYSLAYDGSGNLTGMVDPLGNSIAFSYESAFEQLTKVADQKGNATGYNYDERGNLTAITYADGSLETFAYNDQGYLTVSANRRGQTINYTYDDQFRLVKKEYPDGSTADYTYDARGNLLTAVDSDSSTTYQYDAGDRLTRVTDADGRFIAYTYDGLGRGTSVTDHLGNAVKYSYDDAGRLARVTDGSDKLIASYTYDSDTGNLTRSDNGNGTYTVYGYDLAGQLTSLVNHKADDTINSSFTYTYDSLGRRSSVTTLEGTT
ncbi:hypothetical protein IQ225_01405, partial [Synechocystis salina LEGE 06155]|nr:hypothetical protein [Synechocystis salina LEGE 06155]